MLSIIIITKNEEFFLPRLLKSIKNQTFKDYEIIVSDAGSKDKTLLIAKEYGCKIIHGGLPSKGRNNGAKNAKYDLLLFLDADVILNKYFLERNILEFKKRRLDIAGVYSKPIESNLLSLFYVFLINFFERMFQKTLPVMMGYCIFVKKNIFDKINGFDESLTFNEDTDFIRRSCKNGKFRMLESVSILISMRRFEIIGYLSQGVIYLYYHVKIFVFGKIKKEIGYFNINYNSLKKLK